jgi:vitamin K-dependent gamma-carboxylase
MPHHSDLPENQLTPPDSISNSEVGSGPRPSLPWWRRLLGPVPIDSMVVFRVAFGLIMVWEVCRYFSYGWIDRYYLEPDFLFTYYGFDWVQPWPGHGMYWHFLVLGGLAIGIALGLFYRVCMALFFLGFTYVFLLCQTRYLNHFYLISWISFLLIFVPAHRAFSLDALLWRKRARPTVPAWSLWLLRAQLGIAHIFSGIAKLTPDWLRGEPLRQWVRDAEDFPLIGPYLTQEWAVYLLSYGGLLIDLLIVPMLLWRRTRWLGLVIALVFNLMNARLFSIGIFPWFMIAGVLLFLEPDWPRRLTARLRWTSLPPPPETAAAQPSPLRWSQRATLSLLGLYLLVQVLIPLRHWLYPGSVHWTEEGHNYSWHMKLRDKETFSADFWASDPAEQLTWEIDPEGYLTPRQVAKMTTRPAMIQQFARHVADEYARQGLPNLEVRAQVMVSLNGRNPQLLVDPRVDLAAQPRTWRRKPWIMPLVEPLRVGDNHHDHDDLHHSHDEPPNEQR